MMVKFKKTFFCYKEQDIFNVLSSYLETNCVGICTDGALSMVGSIRGFASLVKKKKILMSPHTPLYSQRGAGFKHSCR
jgi:hypothetical protein